MMLAAPSRLVDEHVFHDEPISFMTLADRVVTPSTRYLILDLDRTLHLGRNMGELLGWELLAHRAFGAAAMEAMEADRVPGRLLFFPSRPFRSVRYLALGGRVWAGPGLYYLFLGKIPARIEWLGRGVARWFGPDAMRRVQRVPQKTLLRCIEAASPRVVHRAMERVWARHTPDLVVEKENLATLRRRCPHLRIIISTASPQVVADCAKVHLGADEAVGSTAERINSGPEKIAHLVESWPDALSEGVETIGMSDNGYGEDACFAAHFTKVVAINSTFPFSAEVPAASPVRAVHCAEVLTRKERARRAEGHSDWLDPRRLRMPELTVELRAPAPAHH